MNFFHDQQRDLLIYSQHSPFMLNALPEARLHENLTIVPRTLRNCQVLRHFNYPVPEIMQDYDWPIEPGRKPLAHQKVYANFSVLHPRMFNLGDPGTMKTLSTLWAADWLMRQHGPGFRALVIAPLTILETVWANAIFKNFLGRRSFEIIHGSAEKRRQLLAKKADFSIVNFEGVGVGATTRKRIELGGLSQDLADRKDIQLVIIDEASAYRDATTKRSRLYRIILGDRDYQWMLTGTPTPNAPTDAYGLAKIINNAWGKTFRGFQAETMLKLTEFKWVPQRDGYDKARALLTPSIRYDITQVWDGPEMTTQQRSVELTDQQKKLMADLKRDLQVTIRTGTPITATNEAAARQKFLQISLGAIYDEAHNVHQVDAEPRYTEVESIIESTSRKVLIFVGLTSVVNLLYQRLSRKWKCGVINGPVASKDRPGIIRAFETDPAFKVIICDAQSTAHGINEFVVADTVIWLGPTDKTELYIQGNKRAHRPGQKYPVTIFQIVSNALEKEIFKRLETNTTLQGSLLDVIRRGEL